MRKAFFILLVSSYCSLQSSVEHKDEFIDKYLSNISANMDEKTQLLPYIKDKKKGIYLDIGTGGDAVAMIATNLDPCDNVTLIAADIDQAVLNSIPLRRPEILPFLTQQKGVKVELKQMSAVDFQKIENDSLNGIGASALTHEVFSYAAPLSSIDQFMKQVTRSLVKEGVFIYRDPRWVDNPDELCLMTIHRKLAKYYATLFLSKFFDRDFSLIRDYRGNCSKPLLHLKEEVYMHVYDKTLKSNRKISFVDFFQLPTSRFDFNKSFSIEAKRGLLAEIERHYLMYLKDFYAPGFLDDENFLEAIDLTQLLDEPRQVLVDYCTRKQIPWAAKIDPVDFPALQREYHLLEEIFENGFMLTDDQLQYFLKTYNNHPLIYFRNGSEALIDIKLVTLLFQGKNRGLYALMNHHFKVPWDLLEHLKLEGEEHYFYKTQQELLIYFGQVSRYFLKNTSKDSYMLAPIDPASIKVVSRDFYQRTLERDFLVVDFHGNIQMPVTEKNIFHLKLQHEDSAKLVYRALTQQFPGRYPQIEAWIADGFR